MRGGSAGISIQPSVKAFEVMTVALEWPGIDVSDSLPLSSETESYCRLRSETRHCGGLIADWPAFADAERNWRGSRWDELMADEAGPGPDFAEVSTKKSRRAHASDVHVPRCWTWASTHQTAG